ncbi:unnamed protein product [Caenorhabditis auriculariae]|uniref:Uncharacterized protein n=1 Tax=Caenorhabditis auriculariae TaxID=2777116 RepID=A0A8S1HHG6_9PELO|nr:unnamed protein product [Caenorhabditis auriculariae]
MVELKKREDQRNERTAHGRRDVRRLRPLAPPIDAWVPNECGTRSNETFDERSDNQKQVLVCFGLRYRNGWQPMLFGYRLLRSSRLTDVTPEPPDIFSFPARLLLSPNRIATDVEFA